MKNIIIPSGFKPEPHQMVVMKKFNEGIRFILKRWPRRAGKDLMDWIITVREMVKRPGNYCYFYPTFSMGRTAFWENKTNEGRPFLDYLLNGTEAGDDIEKCPIVKSLNNQDMKIELHSGSIFRVMGTDNIDRIRGSNPIGAVMSEYAFQDPRAWEVISPILLMNGGWALFNSTPDGENHMYHLEMAVQDNPQWYVDVKQSLWPERPNYLQPRNPGIIELERASGKPESWMEREYGASYGSSIEGSFYGNELREATKAGRIGSFMYNPNKPVSTFWDIGFNDDTVIWFRQTDGDRIIFIDYLEDHGQPMSYYVRELANRGYRYATHYLPHDAENQTGHSDTLKQELESFARQYDISDNFETIPKTRSVQGDIYKTRERFYRYHFNAATCSTGIDRLRRYHRKYDYKTGSFMEQHAKDGNQHAADALRMEATSGSDADVFIEDETYDDFKVINSFDPFNYRVG